MRGHLHDKIASTQVCHKLTPILIRNFDFIFRSNLDSDEKHSFCSNNRTYKNHIFEYPILIIYKIFLISLSSI